MSKKNEQKKKSRIEQDASESKSAVSKLKLEKNYIFKNKNHYEFHN
jgi:hypothetical protein